MADNAPALREPKPLDVAGQLQRRGCVDIVSVTLSRLPPGARLSAGADNGDGTWTLSAADLGGLTLIPPPALWGRTSLSVTAQAMVAADGRKEAVATAFGLAVDFGPPPAPPEPLVVAAPPPSLPPPEDAQTVALDIDLGLPADAPQPIAVTIGGIPMGATLSAGLDRGAGAWVLGTANLAGLTMILPADWAADIELDIAATAADGSRTAGVLQVSLTEDGDVLPATPEPEPVPEPAPEPELEVTAEWDAEPEFIRTPAFAPEFIAESVEPVADAKPARAKEPRKAAAGVAPIAYWKLDENQPGVVGDETGDHPGLSRGDDPARAKGMFDAVDVFDGVDDHIEIPDATDLRIADGALTVWFDAFATGQGTIAAKGRRDGDHLALSIRGRRLQFTIRAGGVAHIAAGGAFAANEWNQAVVAWGADGMKLFLNGQGAGADPFRGGLAGITGPWIFGAVAAQSGPADFFHGELDDIALFADPLPEDDARRLFQVGVIGLMEGAAPVGDDWPAADSGLDLAAIPPEEEGPESLATIDAEDEEAGYPEAEPEAGDSPIDLAAVPAEAEGPESLATIDAEAPDSPEPEAGDSAIDLAAVPAEVEGPESLATIDAGRRPAAGDRPVGDGGEVFIFAAGAEGDFFQQGDGWADTAAVDDDEAVPGGDGVVTIEPGGEPKPAGGDKLEW